MKGYASLRKGTQYGCLYKRRSHCNIITYIIKYILLSIHGLFILFTMDFPVKNIVSLFQWYQSLFKGGIQRF